MRAVLFGFGFLTLWAGMWLALGVPVVWLSCTFATVFALQSYGVQRVVTAAARAMLTPVRLVVAGYYRLKRWNDDRRRRARLGLVPIDPVSNAHRRAAAHAPAFNFPDDVVERYRRAAAGPRPRGRR